MILTCLKREQMRAFLAGELTANAEAEVARHLEECARCEHLASELSDDAEARRLAPQNGREQVDWRPAEPEIDDLRRRLHALGLFTLACENAIQSNAAEHSSASGDKNQAKPELLELGPYKIVRQIGSGAFGIVYLALDRRLNRQVAMKIARASVLTDPALRTRFFREAETLARLSHPHILPVYEADEIEGLCYLALAYCPGPTLDDWLGKRSEPLEPAAAVQLILPLVQAVEHAHSRGILHRDIKPGNILLSPAEPNDMLPVSPQLTDFGLAKVLEERSNETMAGMVLGTPHYMAPEQAAGHAERIGPPTDVYSLGAVLYQLLSGRLPIEGNSTIDTLRRVLIDEPLEIDRVVNGVPADLGAIVRKCLQKSPAQRYQSAAELADDLERFVAGRPTQARPLGLVERTRRSLTRHKNLLPLLSLAATAIGLSLGLFYYSQRLSQSEYEFQQTARQLDLAKERAESDTLVLLRQAYASDLAAAGVSTIKGDVSQAVEALRRQQPIGGKTDLRGLEWHYLWAVNSRQNQVFLDAGNPIYKICLAPDGKELAAVGSRGLLRLFDATSLQLRRVIATGQVECNDISFSPDGQFAATAGDDGTVRVFHLAERTEVLKIPAHPEKVFGVIFYDEGRKLASCAKEPIIRLWDSVSGAAIGTLPGHTGNVEAIAFSPDGQVLASVARDKIAVLWNLKEKFAIRTLKGHTSPIMTVCFSPDGNRVVTGGDDHSVVLWNAHTGRKLHAVSHLDKVQSVTFSADGARLYVGDRSGAVHQYRVGQHPTLGDRARLEADADEGSWHAHETRVWCVEAGTNPDTFYSTGEDHFVRRWDRRPAARAEQTIAAVPGDRFVDLDFSPDGKFLFALHEISGVTAYDSRTLKPRFSLDCRHSRWTAIKVLAGRDEVAAGNAHGVIAIWNYNTGELRRVLAVGNGECDIMNLAYSKLSDQLAVSAYGFEEIRFFDANTGAVIAGLPTTNHTAIALSPDGKYLAVDSLDAVTLYDVAKQRRLRELSGHAATVTSLAFSADGKLLASASVDRTVKLWSLGGEQLVTLTGHLVDVVEVAFTPDGRSLFSIDDRGLIAVTHVPTRQRLFELPVPAERLRGMTISPDSRRLAAIRTHHNQLEVVVLGEPPIQDGERE